MKDQSENLKRVIMSISDSFKEENHKCAIDNNLYKFLLEKINQGDIKNISVDSIYFNYLRPYQNILETLLKETSKSKNYEDYFDFLLNSEFYQHNLDKIMSKMYGGACSHDKTMFVMRSYESKLLNLNHDNVVWNNMDYYTPDTLTYNNWMNYMFSLKQLYWGNVDKYLLSYKEMLEKNDKEINSEEYKLKVFKRNFSHYYEKLITCSSPEPEFDKVKSEQFINEYSKNLLILNSINELILSETSSVSAINQECNKLIFELKDILPLNKWGFSKMIEMSKEHHHEDELFRVYHPEFDCFFKRYISIKQIKRGII